jgi:hypothetical protein
LLALELDLVAGGLNLVWEPRSGHGGGPFGCEAVDLLALELDLVAGGLNLAAALELVAVSLGLLLDRPR